MENSILYSILHWFIQGLAVLVTSKVIRGFQVKNIVAAVVAAVVIAFANIFIWPLLIFLTLPINILTLGLFTFVVNGAVLKICAAVLPGFQIETWWAAIFGAIVLSIVGTVLHYALV